MKHPIPTNPFLIVLFLVCLGSSASAGPAAKAAAREALRNNYHALDADQQAQVAEVAAERKSVREERRANLTDEEKQQFLDNNGFRKLDRLEDRVDRKITTGPKDRVEDRRDRLNLKPRYFGR